MTPEQFLKLAALGLTTEQIAGVMEVMSADTEVRRAKGRDRWHKWNDKRLANVSTRLQTTANDSREGVTRVEDNLLTKNQDGKKEEKKVGAPAAQTPLSELQTVLDAEHAQAVVDHRLKLRKPLTAYAARKLAKHIATAPDPNDAADTMIACGWAGFELSWLENRKAPTARGTGPPRKPNAFDAYEEIARERGWIDEPKFVPSPDSHDQRLSAERSEPQSVVVDLRPGAFRRVRSGDM